MEHKKNIHRKEKKTFKKHMHLMHFSKTNKIQNDTLHIGEITKKKQELLHHSIELFYDSMCFFLTHHKFLTGTCGQDTFLVSPPFLQITDFC